MDNLLIVTLGDDIAVASIISRKFSVLSKCSQVGTKKAGTMADQIFR